MYREKEVTYIFIILMCTKYMQKTSRVSTKLNSDIEEKVKLIKSGKKSKSYTVDEYLKHVKTILED